MTLDAVVTITIPGNPATKGSMKCIGRVGKHPHVLIEDHKSSDPWRKTVAGWVTRKWPAEQRAGGRQALAADVLFTIDRPRSHFRTGARQTPTLRPEAPEWPTGHNTGDLDKLVRLVLDALQEGESPVLPDDAAVVVLRTAKVYVGAPDALDWPGVRIRLRPAPSGTGVPL